MHKYKVLIFDEDIREDISKIDLGALGFEISPCETKKCYFDDVCTKIDVVIADISELATNSYLNKLVKSGGVKTIVVSHESGFGHVKDAIKLGAVDYILKPADLSELSDALLRTKHTLDERLELKSALDSFKENYEKMLPVMREHFLNDLLWGMLSQDEINRQLGQYNLTIGKSQYKMVVVFELEQNLRDAPPFPREPSIVSVMQIIKDKLSKCCKNVVFFSSPLIVAITAGDALGFIDEAIGAANDICSKCFASLDIKLSAGIGNYCADMEEIHKSFKEAKAALSYEPVAGFGKAIYIDEINRDCLGFAPYDDRSEERLFSMIKFGTEKQISLFASEMSARFASLDGWSRSAFAFSIFNEVHRIVRRYELYGERQVMDILNRFITISTILPDKKVLSKWFLDLFLCMSSYVKIKRKSAQYNIAKEAKRYIDTHYQDSGLSVSRLCEHLHVSQSYFSSVFKNETGVSYVRYLTELRMSRAVSLLQQTDDKTHIIAVKVGYEDPNYFSYVFKKRFGVSPAQYRKIV